MHSVDRLAATDIRPCPMWKRLIRNARVRFGRDHSTLDGAVLPARHLRFCGSEFQDDAYFLGSARREADRLVERCGVTRASRVLDVGCGPGRLAIGILDRVGGIAEYLGVDVHRPSVRWCERHIARRHPSFAFRHLDVRSGRYNPAGSADGAAVRLPAPDECFDAVYLYSVFSHMLPADVRAYLREFRRVLAPGGTLFFTAFVEDDVQDVSENPEGYRRPWTGPLHCVRYGRSVFDEMLATAGFAVARFEYGGETDGQSAVYARQSLMSSHG